MIVGVVFVLYYFVFKQNNTDGESGLLVEDNSLSKNFQVDKNLLTILLEMKSIRLNEELFNSPVFKSLNDLSIKIEQQEVGRSNPFAPIESKK